ncbi:MAG: hypothetical protein LBJ20_06985 [Candidatus Methanoplasma sp.]|nr:hypothetical protein [Candidatus Methanoplasma sp.]
MHIIVHGIWDDEVREHTLEVLPEIFSRHGMPFRLVADYFDVEKSIAHHT